MEIAIKGEAKEVAALVVAIQERQAIENVKDIAHMLHSELTKALTSTDEKLGRQLSENAIKPLDDGEIDELAQAIVQANRDSSREAQGQS